MDPLAHTFFIEESLKVESKQEVKNLNCNSLKTSKKKKKKKRRSGKLAPIKKIRIMFHIYYSLYCRKTPKYQIVRDMNKYYNKMWGHLTKLLYK